MKSIIIPIESTSISLMEINTEKQTLEVVFKKGDRYQYQQIPRATINRLLVAKSFGTFINKRIKPSFAVVKVSK